MNASLPRRFEYVETDPLSGSTSAMPYVPIALQLGGRQVRVSALVDSGASLNVLPFDVGLRLGATWEQQPAAIRLGGNMAESEARGLILIGRIEGLDSVRLAFAWSQSNRIPVILGQTNFFLEFDVRFCRSQLFFEVAPRSKPGSGAQATI